MNAEALLLLPLSDDVNDRIMLAFAPNLGEINSGIVIITDDRYPLISDDVTQTRWIR